MPAFVGTDAAKALRVLEPFDMLLNRATGDACRGDHLRKGYLRIAADQLQQSVDGFLTTFFLPPFSYHLATRPWERKATPCLGRRKADLRRTRRA